MSAKTGEPHSPVSPLLANIALNDLDRALDRGSVLLKYARYLDDVVVLAPDTEKGRAWANRALERIREDAERIGVALNTEKTMMVTLTDPKAFFAFLGFEFRWVLGRKSGCWYPAMTPRPKKVVQVLRTVRDVLRNERSSPVKVAVARVSEVVRGWANYFRVGNSSQAFAKIRYNVELRVRRFVSRKQKRMGFGWKRWSQDVAYQTWGLYSNYPLVYGGAARARSNGTINPLR